MTAPPPEQREERHAFLNREIDRLIERHKDMPTDELKSRVSAQINEHVREMDAMAEEERLREKEPERHPEPAGHSSTGAGAYPFIGAGIICIIIGALTGLSLLILGGMGVLLVVATSLTKSRARATRSPEPRQAERRNWEWKP